MSELEDGTFDVVNCLNLFTSLPSEVRRDVAKEIFRVLQPGGIIAFNDAVQPHDSASQGPDILRKRYNEDFLASYEADDLNEIFFAAGFKPGPTSPIIAAQSKVMSWVKPFDFESKEEVEILQQKSIDLFKSEMMKAEMKDESANVETEMKMEAGDSMAETENKAGEAVDDATDPVVEGTIVDEA